MREPALRVRGGRRNWLSRGQARDRAVTAGVDEPGALEGLGVEGGDVVVTAGGVASQLLIEVAGDDLPLDPVADAAQRIKELQDGLALGSHDLCDDVAPFADGAFGDQPADGVHRLLERLGEFEVLTAAQTEEDIHGIDQHVAGRVLLLSQRRLAGGDTTRDDDRDRPAVGGERRVVEMPLDFG